MTRMREQFTTVLIVAVATAALLYAPSAWRMGRTVVTTLQGAQQMYVWLGVPLAEINGKPTNRAQLLDCAVKRELAKQHATNVNPAFATDTGGCPEN